jgi:hypothetical protein
VKGKGIVPMGLSLKHLVKIHIDLWQNYYSHMCVRSEALLRVP